MCNSFNPSRLFNSMHRKKKFDRETRDILNPTEKRVQQREKAKEQNYKANQTSEILALKEERLLSKFENARMI